MTMRIVREPFAVLGVFLVVAGLLLIQYGQSRNIGAALPFGLLYAGAGAVSIAFSFVPRNRR